jgi:hypothetical protein
MVVPLLRNPDPVTVGSGLALVEESVSPRVRMSRLTPESP